MEKNANLLILGAPKAATTSLAYYLNQHPLVYIPKIKEINYFGNDDYYNKGINWYKDFFNGANETNQVIFGEATPTYLGEAKTVASRVKSSLGDNVKFICLLRSPVNRAWSHYLHNIRHNIESREFRVALNDEIEDIKKTTPIDMKSGYFSYGNYVEHVEEWYKHFNAENFYFVLYEDFIKHPTPIILEIYSFLGVDDKNIAIDLTAKNVGGSPRSKYLMSLLVSPPDLIKSIVKKMLPMSTRRRILRRLIDFNSKAFNKAPALSSVDELFLQERYQGSFTRLEELTGLDLSTWLNKDRIS